MFTARISAAETNLFIDEAAGERSRATEISYQSDRPVAIWFRHNLYVWIRLTPYRLGLPAHPGSGAFRGADLHPGDILEYRVYQDMQHNPSCGPRNGRGAIVPYDGVTLMGLKHRPDRRRWLHYSRSETRGTGCRYRIGTPGTTSHVSIEMARSEPLALDNGHLGFAAPEMAALGLNRQSYDFNLKPLVPGGEYHVVARCSDAAGNWWCERHRFTMPEWPAVSRGMRRMPMMVAGHRAAMRIPSNG